MPWRYPDQVIKALFCAMLLFAALAALGVALRGSRRR